MFKHILVILAFCTVVYGAYAYYTSQEVIDVIEVDIPAVGFEEAVQQAQDVVDTAQQVQETVEDVQETVEDVQEAAEQVSDAFEVVQDVVDMAEEITGGNEESQEVIEETSEDIPAQYNLAVPFTSQAPHANWDLPYQEACEEASMFMIYTYLEGWNAGQIDAGIADEALLAIVNYQQETIGDYLDTTVAQTIQIMQDWYAIPAYVIENPTADQIKEEIAQGRPVIVPAYGKVLGNPYFSGDGPLYHMFVIKGYTEHGFITNDPGTRHGEDFVYDIDVIMNAMGDWNSGSPQTGAKRVIFLDL